VAIVATETSTERTVGSPTAPLKFERFFIMMFENHGYSQCMGKAYWRNLAQTGLSLSNFKAITHPSQPNYVAQIGGDLLGVTGDQNFDVEASNLADLLESHGLSWKSYQEAYTPKAGGDCLPDSKSGTYYRKHNPFMTFNNIRKNITRCNMIVPATQLDKDIAAGTLPSFMYYTPDINNDAHDTDLDYAGKFLQGWLNKYMSIPKFVQNTLLLITFDEDEFLEGNHIYSVLLGPYVTRNSTESSAYTHYSLTATIERNLGLGDLGRKDKSAKDFIAAIKDSHVRTPADEAELEQVLANPPPPRASGDRDGNDNEVVARRFA